MIRPFVLSSLRRQLVIGLAATNAVLSAATLWYFNSRQASLLATQQEASARALSSSFASSAPPWLASRDLAGLQELVDAQLQYPDLRFAMILDDQGRVLAHTERQRIGQFVHDLPSQPTVTVRGQGSTLVDLAHPVLMGGRPIGWVRVGLGQESSSQQSEALWRGGLLHALISIAGGSLIVLLVATRLTRRLARVQQVADAVEAGDLSQRARVSGSDEAGRLAHSFDAMLDALTASHTALEETERRWVIALEGAGHGVWDWNVEQGTVFFSPRWKSMLGYADDEIGHSLEEWSSRVHPDDLPRCRIDLQRHFEGETPVYCNEHRERARDGSWRWILAQGIVASRTPDGKPARVVGTHTDMTERHEAELSMQQSEARANRIIDAAPDAMLVTDADGRILRANSRATELFGYGAGALEGMRVDALIAPPVPERHADTPVSGRERLALRRDGAQVPVNVSMATLRSGAQAEVVVSVIDISQRKAMEASLDEHRRNLERLVTERTAKLADSEETLRLILESSAEGLFGTDCDGRFTFANAAAARLLGHSPQSLLQRKADDFIRPAPTDGAPHEAQTSLLLQALRSGQAGQSDAAWLLRSDGTQIPVEYAVTPMFRDDQLVGAVSSFHDISARQAAERAQAAALAEAERLARMRSEFLANMSHEIRTPLNGVLGLAQIGLKESAGRQREHYARILDSGQHLLQVVNDVLDFSRIESGRITLDDSRFELGPVIDRALEMTLGHAQARGLQCRVDEQAALPATLRGDAMRLTQILVNLLGNAVKFTERGNVSLQISRCAEQVRFDVSDTGIGISDEQMQRLFRPFQQADGSTTRRYGGSGLGLAISRSFAECMGGRIEARSSLGQGSCFSLFIPLREAEGVLMASLAGVTVHCAGLGGSDTEDLRTALSRCDARLEPMADPFTALRENTAATLVLPLRCLDNPSCAAAAARFHGQLFFVTEPGIAALPARLPDAATLLERPLRVRHLFSTARITTAPAPAAAALTRRLAGLRVLAVEDMEVNRQILEELLEFEGATVLLAEHGAQAVARVHEHGAAHVDIVLMDIQMPVMDGLTATAELRRIAPQLPVIGLTAHALAQDRARCLNAGMVDHVTKPIDIERLIDAILRHARRTDTTAHLGAFSFDLQALCHRFRNRPAFIERLLGTVLESYAGTPERLREALHRSDWPELSRLSHSLKGVGGNLAAQPLALLATAAEQDALAGNGERIEALATALETLLQDVRTRLATRTSMQHA